MEENTVQDVEVQETVTETEVEKEQEQEKKFTQDELNSIIAKEKSKWEKKAESDKEEAKKLARMNAEEKAKYELDKANETLAKREAEITRRELTAEAKSILSERGLSTELHSLLNYESAETVQESIKVLETAIQRATEKAVEERLKGNTPKKDVLPSSQITGFDKVNQKYKK